MISFLCPSCRHMHLWPEQASKGNVCIWCSCGLLLHIGGDDGTTPLVARPLHPKMVEHPKAVCLCTRCWKAFPTFHLRGPEGQEVCEECEAPAIKERMARR